MDTNLYQKPGGTVLRSDSANRRGGIPLLNLHFPSCLTLWRRAFSVHITELDFAQLINFYVLFERPWRVNSPLTYSKALQPS